MKISELFRGSFDFQRWRKGKNELENQASNVRTDPKLWSLRLPTRPHWDGTLLEPPVQTGPASSHARKQPQLGTDPALKMTVKRLRLTHTSLDNSQGFSFNSRPEPVKDETQTLGLDLKRDTNHPIVSSVYNRTVRMPTRHYLHSIPIWRHKIMRGDYSLGPTDMLRHQFR
jgi:hypothetical protein